VARRCVPSALFGLLRYKVINIGNFGGGFRAGRWVKIAHRKLALLPRLRPSRVLRPAKRLVPLQMASVDRFKGEHASSEKDAMIAAYALRMFQKDGELLSLMGDEIYCARALRSLPSAKRLAHYNENVLPLKEKEQQAGKEWAAIAKEAADKGVSWSDKVSKATKVLE
jgi:hypothetical protein